MRKFGIIMCSLFMVALVGGSFAAAGASSSSTVRTLTVIREITHTEWQGTPDVPKVGDRFEFTGKLFKNGYLIGRGGSACTVVQASANQHTNLCEGTWKLPGGTVSTQAYFVFNGHLSAVAITGGTGIYRDARGQVETEFLRGGKQKVTFEFS